MRRLVWLGLGAAAGWWAAKRSDAVVADVRERGVVGTVGLAATTAARVAQSATSTAAGVAQQARAAAEQNRARAAARPAAPQPSPQTSPSPSRTSREVRP